MPFKNRVRLPFYITRPQYPSEQNVFRRADGSTKTLSAIVRKTYEGETDYLPEAIHERLKIALAHDDVTIEGQRYLGGLSVDGDYDIDWSKFIDFPLAKAAFKVQVTPFNYSNDNCQTCDEATQMSLENDTVTGPYEALDEGQEYEYNVFANDSICCSPITAEVVTTNSLYVESATIDASSGIVTVLLKDNIPSATLANLLTYRVTCPNGGYDEADVFANISGSVEVCLVPTSFILSAVDETTATVSYSDPSDANNFNWQLYLASDLITPVQTGSTTSESVSLTGLTPGSDYVFYIQAVCAEDNMSEFSTFDFSTIGEPTAGCGRYQVTYNDGTHNRTSTTVTYINCAGIETDITIINLQTRFICALESEPGNPVEIIGGTSFEYVEPC